MSFSFKEIVLATPPSIKDSRLRRVDARLGPEFRNAAAAGVGDTGDGPGQGEP